VRQIITPEQHPVVKRFEAAEPKGVFPMWFDYLQVAVALAAGFGVFVYTGQKQANHR